MGRTKSVALAMIASVLAMGPLCAAQTAHGHHTSASHDAGDTARSETDPGTFAAPQTAQTTDVGSGTGPSTAQGPVGDLRSDDSSAPEITGPIGPADVARIMQVQMPRLRPCYDRARAAHPRLQGRIDVRFTIGRDGRVTQATATGLPDAPEVATCVATTLRQTTFPQPENGPLPFVYPINFAPPPPVVTHAHHGHSGH